MVSFVAIFPLGIVAFTYELIGPRFVEKIFELLNVPWNFQCFCYCCLITLIVLIGTYFLRRKL